MMRAWAALAAILAGGGTAMAQADAPLLSDPPLQEEEPLEPAPFEEGVELNFNPPRWMGLSFRASIQQGGGKMNVARGKVIDDFGGARPPLSVTLEYDEREYEAVGVGIVSDYDLFRLSLDF